MTNMVLAMHEIRACPDCETFLGDHPSLRVERVTETQRNKAGEWYHVTNRGRTLHRLACKEAKESKNDKRDE